MTCRWIQGLKLLGHPQIWIQATDPCSPPDSERPWTEKTRQHTMGQELGFWAFG